jgi:quercetin dioxygenase-like cupin family protein
VALAVDNGLFGHVFVRRVDYDGVGDTLPAHTHGQDHITVCCAGRLEVRIQNAPARVQTLRPGEWIEVPARAMHDLVALDPDTVSLCIFAIPDDGSMSGTH